MCPAGNTLYLKNSHFEVKGLAGVSYMGRETDCCECSMRVRCLRNTNTVARQVTFFTGRTQEIKREVNATSRMIEKIDGERERSGDRQSSDGDCGAGVWEYTEYEEIESI